MISGTSLANASAQPSPPPSGGASLPNQPNSHTPQKSNLAPTQSAPSAGTLLPSPSNLPASNNGASASQSNLESTTAISSAKAAKESASQAARSFRVTLEDPCWKVLPAALKKYKINDDWKQYALFICFGNTGELIIYDSDQESTCWKITADPKERCLSYDEKPLLLFQKLKESGQKPVFMLRHIVSCSWINTGAMSDIINSEK